MTEGVLDFAPSVEPLKSISPTHYVSLTHCALREVWALNRTVGLLPSSPAARLGQLIHGLLQAAGEGDFISGGRPGIEERWRKLVRATEQEMQQSWLERNFVPLARSVPDFEVRHIQVRERALEITQAAAGSHGAALDSAGVGADYGFEITLSSPDGVVSGRVDSVLPSAEGPIIRDYKSGAILEGPPKGASVLKPGYETQLKFYAALYASSRGRWPARLEIIPLYGTAQSVSFDELECSRLIEGARALYEKVNSIISQTPDNPYELQRELANPAPENCRHCPYRPGCIPYRSTVSQVYSRDAWPRDLWGQVKEVRQLGNSKFAITLDTQIGLARIRGLTPTGRRHPGLTNLSPGDYLAVFNLGTTGSEHTFVETQYTTIYREISSRAPNL